MKYTAFLFITGIVLLFFVFTAFGDRSGSEASVDLLIPEQVEVPDDVQTILDKSCLPCHGPDGSGKAKMKWNYGKMDEYSQTKLISKLMKVVDEVSEEKMPPPKNLKKYPERKLSAEEKSTLTGWAEGMAEQLAGSE